MVRRSAAAVLFAVVILSGCGSSHHVTASKPPPTRKSAPPATPAVPGPHGYLTEAEYRLIVREYAELRTLDADHPSRSALARARASCDAAAQPGTALAQLVGQDCRNALLSQKASDAFLRATDECQGRAAGGRVECLAAAYIAFAQSFRRTRTTVTAINQELARRGIRGLCARSIGAPSKVVAAFAGAEFAARQAAASLRAGDSDGYARSASILQDSLLAQEGSGTALEDIRRSCPHHRASTPAPRSRHPKPRKPRQLQPGDTVRT